jgi:hypothetical protein
MLYDMPRVGNMIAAQQIDFIGKDGCGPQDHPGTPTQQIMLVVCCDDIRPVGDRTIDCSPPANRCGSFCEFCRELGDWLADNMEDNRTLRSAANADVAVVGNDAGDAYIEAHDSVCKRGKEPQKAGCYHS